MKIKIFCTNVVILILATANLTLINAKDIDNALGEPAPPAIASRTIPIEPNTNWVAPS